MIHRTFAGRSQLSSILHRRGAALMMTLSVVAAASILSWAMLSASALRSQVDVNAVDSIDASYLAESGVSYALYYLRYPAKSPVALTNGAYDRFYAGQTNLTLWSDARGKVDVSVTNTATNTFTVRSTALVNGTRRVVEADAQLTTKGYNITSAAGFNGAFAMPNAMTINGPVISSGAVGNQGTRITGSPTIVPTGSSVVPSADEIALLSETKVPYTGGIATDRTYTFAGETYCAERVPGTTITGTLSTARPTLNPKNVWYCDGTLTINNLTLNGVLVVDKDSKLNVSGPTNTITAPAGMVALVVGKDVDLKQTTTLAAKLTVNGAMWLGGRIVGSGYTSRTDGRLNVDGALLMGGAAPSIALTSTSPTVVNYVAGSTASVDNLSKVRTVTGVTVLGWRAAE